MWLLFLIFMFLVPFNIELYQQEMLLNDLLVLGGILRESPGGREKEIILV